MEIEKRSNKMSKQKLCITMFAFTIGIVFSSHASCYFPSINKKVLGTDSIAIEGLMLRDTLRDTISRSHLTTDLCDRFKSSLICFVATLDTFKSSYRPVVFTGLDRTIWLKYDSIHVAIDTVLKGGNIVSSSFWRVEQDMSKACISEKLDTCSFYQEDAGSYENFKGKRYLFFADSLDSLHFTSVRPMGCRSDYGNRIDSSKNLWSDYPYYYFKQISIPLNSVFEAFKEIVSVKQYSKKEPCYLSSYSTGQSNYVSIYDLHGRKLAAIPVNQWPDFRKNLSTGTYFLKTRLNSEFSVVKTVLQK
jgi:hypothetical protein